jgi:hypothetical protein
VSLGFFLVRQAWAQSEMEVIDDNVKLNLKSE